MIDDQQENSRDAAAQKRSFELAWSKFKAIEQGIDDSVDAVFGRSLEMRSIAAKVILSLGWVVVEDFREIYVLAEMCLGVGAMKLLRGLYERSVTASYLSLHPEAAQAFLDYSHVQRRKFHRHAELILDLSDRFPREKVEELERNYERVKGQFEETLCEQCGTKRIRFSWSSLDLASMAHHAEDGLREHYLHCYYMPTLQAHATTSSILARVKTTSDGKFLPHKSQYSHAETALVYGHLLLIYALRTQNAYFKLGLDSMIQARLEEWYTMLSELKSASSLGV